MARYTDIDKLIAEYDRVHVGPAGGARKLIVEAPIADVAPRAEVEYWKEQCFHACMNNGCLDKAIVKAAVAREIFEEIEDVINGIGYFDELDLKVLKNKYAEGRNER